MEIKPLLMRGKVMHKRLLPKENLFTYGIYYIAVPLSDLVSFSKGVWFGVNRPGLLSFYNKDHGDRSGKDLRPWIDNILHENNVTADGEVFLITMPRVLGYVFNPVSFWLCYDSNQELKAVLCEVNNTFGETHSYLCANENGDSITGDQRFKGKKLFHVSPFLKRDGDYAFRFDITDRAFGAWIDFYNENQNKQLLTALTGNLSEATACSLRSVFWAYPLVTLKTVFLIHWQAFKLVTKGINYISKPEQKPEKLSKAHSDTEI